MLLSHYVSNTTSKKGYLPLFHPQNAERSGIFHYIPQKLTCPLNKNNGWLTSSFPFKEMKWPLKKGRHSFIFRGARTFPDLHHPRHGRSSCLHTSLARGLQSEELGLQSETDGLMWQGPNSHYFHMGVSKYSGTPKWMVYNGKPY